ncbi:MAG: methyl-accepting chemotaxis protein [Bdellovibrionia bacterium]
MFFQLSLKAKVFIFTLFLSFCLLIVGSIGYWSAERVKSMYAQVTDVLLPGAYHTATMQASSREMVSMLASLGMAGISQEESARLRKRVNESREKMKANYADYAHDSVGSPEEASIRQDVEKKWKQVETQIDLMLTSWDAGSPEGKSNYVKIYGTDFKDARVAFYKVLDHLMKSQKDQIDSWNALAVQAVKNALWLISAAVITGFFLSMFFGYLFSASLAKALTGIAKTLSSGAQEVAQASAGIFHESDSLSSSTAQQAAALQETSSSMAQVSAMIAKNSDNSAHALQTSEESAEASKQGKEVVGEMIQAMSSIEDSNSEIQAQIVSSNEKIGEIVELISEIGDKTKVINDIVFQTKLLSFNASVEAARAGEQGKGFAVVAEEVGNLAVMSGKAAQEISSLLDTSTKRVEEIVQETTAKVDLLIKGAGERVKTGSQIAIKCGEVLDRIVQNVTEVKSRAHEISVASREQNQGASEINRAMGQMDQVTQLNAEAAQRSSESAKRLETQAKILAQSVEDLSRTIFGKSSSSQPDHPERVDSPQSVNDEARTNESSHAA